ncbi:MAG TPA: helix-turn-helix transcriptional regulator [Kiloniellaceae bacterium]
MSRSPRYAVDPAGEPRNLLTPRHLTKQEFGRRLYQLMLAKNWSQADLARRAELGRDSISTYINGKTFPDPLSRKKLADALGVSVDELIPNGMETALDQEFPAVELKQAVGHPGMAWVRINRAMSFATAAKIIDLINQEDRQAKAEGKTEG